MIQFDTTLLVMNVNMSSSNKLNENQIESIVFFDGVCGLCNSTVDFLMNKDTENRLKFAPIQGQTAEQRLNPSDRDLNSIVFLQDGRTWKRSSAIVRILKTLPQPWRLLGSCLWLIPKPIRDFSYSLVARWRYRFFGKHESCRMPTDEDRAKLLD